MKGMDWHYDTAKDHCLPLMDRLRRCPREPDAFVYATRVAAAVATRVALRIFHRFEIVGRDNLLHGTSFVLVANHASHLDALALLSALPLRSLHRAYPLAARDYFGANDLRLALTAIAANVMLFDRDSSVVEGLRLCRRILEEPGNVLVMFPEGTRSIDGHVGVFRRGVGLLLAGGPYPVLPCYIDGTFKAWPKGNPLPRPARVQLAIGEPRTYEHVEQNEAGVLHICADLRRAVLSLAPETQLQTARPISEEAYP